MKRSEIDAAIPYFERLLANDQVHDYARDCNETALHALNELKNDGWIPCSEKLPEENEIVLTTINCGDEGRDIMFASCCENVWQDAYANNLGVLAWRPMPEPWKGEE